MGIHQDIIGAFIDALDRQGIRLSDHDSIKADGAWHRAHVEGDRRHSRNLSYRLFDDDRPAGFFEDHKRGVTGTVSVRRDNGTETPEQRRARIEEYDRRRLEREAERARDYAEAAKAAAEYLERAKRDPATHPYVIRKQARPGPSIRYTDGGLLLIPVYQAPGKLAGYQWITPDGDKYFQDNAEFAGAFHPIVGADKSAVVICEGWATGAALAAALGYSVACAMSAGNLAIVADKMRRLYPDRQLIIGADNDRFTTSPINNPGVHYAQLAARPGDIVMIPVFVDDNPGTDWDDWIRLYGPECCRQALADARSAPASQPDRTEPPGFDDLPEPATIAHADPDHAPASSGALIPASLPAVLLPRIRTDLLSAPDDMAIPPKYSEIAVSCELARQCSESLRYVAKWGRWMHWTGQRWQSDETLVHVEYGKRLAAAVTENAARDYTGEFTTEPQRKAVIAKYGAAATVANILGLARSDPKIAATHEQWDADLWALNTPAGVVDLRTGELRAPVILDYCTKITRTAPATVADCPRWKAFLNRALDNDAETIRFLQKVAGYALTGEVSEHILVFLYGPGGNGKGTFLNTLTHVFGDYAQAASADLVTERKHEAHPTELADLQGARMVIMQEVDEGKKWNKQRLTSLTGGDRLNARYMRQDFFNFQPQFTLIMSGNHKPGLRSVDEAIRRRMRMIPFNLKLTDAERDPRLPELLRAEAAAILRWCIDGCLLWQSEGLRAPASVLAATDEYLEAQDSFGAWIDETCETGEYVSSQRADLYAGYKRWCISASEFVLPLKRWHEEMVKRGFAITEARQGQAMVRGIRRRIDDDQPVFAGRGPGW